MLNVKNTYFLSEISSFFKNNDASKAMESMMNMISGLYMSERTLFDRSTRFNSKYSLLQILTSLILFPCFMIRNPYNFPQTRLDSMIGCGKEVFYRFAQDDRINWRKLLYHLSLQLWTKIRVRSDHKNCTTCLIVDDTDFGKTGKQGAWSGLITTDLKLEFFEAYRIYAQRWALEVVFYDKYNIMRSRSRFIVDYKQFKLRKFLSG